MSEVEMPFVPVVGFWSTDTSISMAGLKEALLGSSSRYPAGMAMLFQDHLAIFDAVGTVSTDWLVFQSLPELEAAVRDGAIGMIRATQVSPRVKALAVDGVSLFGNDRITSTADWPLMSRVMSDVEWQPETLWTLVAAGDIMMDRGVALAVREHGEDGRYLFDGGTARIVRIRCCSFFGYDIPVTEKTGNAGAVRDLLTSADMAMANLESAVLVDAPYHAGGFTFTADASLLDDVDDAGFDFLSLGNNHIRNAGSRGIRTAVAELEARGIAHSGAGLGDDAGQAGYFEIESTGIRVAVIGCDAIVPSWTAGPDEVGTLNCKKSDVAGRIRDVRPTADVVIVFPHWGREYRPTPVVYQERLANEWVAAGADLVVGAHSHIAGAMDDIDGHVIFYSLGNFIFDQDFRQSTMMGVIPEMTFSGSTLVQIELHATVIIDSQPNLISAADGGDFVFDQMREGSEGLLPY